MNAIDRCHRRRSHHLRAGRASLLLENAAGIEPERGIVAGAGDLDGDGAAATLLAEDRIGDLEQQSLDPGRRLRNLRIHENSAGEINRAVLETVGAGETD